MAKILKVKIKREVKNAARKHYGRIYPNEYQRDKITVLAYEFIGDPDAPITRDDGYEYCIGVVSDADAPRFLASDDITEITRQAAETLGAIWRPQTVKITNDDTIISILAKVRAEQPLTARELSAIDPDSAEQGISKSRSFSDLLDATIINRG
jgi:hypothetical protein